VTLVSSNMQQQQQQNQHPHASKPAAALTCSCTACDSTAQMQTLRMSSRQSQLGLLWVQRWELCLPVHQQMVP
jgi:hypothetical protein